MMVLLISLLVVAPAEAATLHYDAYVAGIKVGAATVTIDRDRERYRITGDAAAGGVAHLFSDWRSEFHAGGQFIDGYPELNEYGYDERERKKRRILTLEDGLIVQTKNGEPRPPVPLLDGLDVLTAFFITPACWGDQLLHTGRFNYRISGRATRAEGGCQFRVLDDDGDEDRVHIVFGSYQGQTVPVRMTTGGLLRGRVVLKSGTSDAEEGSALD